MMNQMIAAAVAEWKLAHASRATALPFVKQQTPRKTQGGSLCDEGVNCATCVFSAVAHLSVVAWPSPERSDGSS